MTKSSIENILHLLIIAHGDREWHKHLEPVAEMVQTILSQNTSDINSRRAFQVLINTYKSWDVLAQADISRITDAIRTGGLAEVKARYIKQSLLAISKKAHGFDLQFLKNLNVNDARNWLTQLPGIGMKTASCVLLFSLGMPAFPVDTHVYRVSKRLGFIDDKTSVDNAHLKLERLVSPQDMYRCHVLLIEHGRKVCKAQRPLCTVCSLKNVCPCFRTFTGAG
jgi:endonuclease-3